MSDPSLPPEGHHSASSSSFTDNPANTRSQALQHKQVRSALASIRTESFDSVSSGGKETGKRVRIVSPSSESTFPSNITDNLSIEENASMQVASGHRNPFRPDGFGGSSFTGGATSTSFDQASVYPNANSYQLGGHELNAFPPSTKEVPGGQKNIDVSTFAQMLMGGMKSQAGTSGSPVSTPPVPNAFNGPDPFDILRLGSMPKKASSGTPVRTPSDSSTASTRSLTLKRQPTLNELSKQSPPRSTESPSVQAAKERLPPPPPPPKSRHGKDLANKGPQIVSFDDFSPNMSETPFFQDHRSTPSISSQHTVAHASGFPGAKHLQYSNSRELLDFESASTSSQEKKAAPPVPLARRTTVSKRTQAIPAPSSFPEYEDPIVSYAPSITESVDSIQKAAPPPPPSRRTGSSHSVPHVRSSSGSIHGERPGDGKAPPPPPPGRHRSSSQASQMSQASFSNAPPPPPPARRKSSKASIDLGGRPVGLNSSTRTSGEYIRSSFDSQRAGARQVSNTSMGSTHRPGSSKDILADMDAFQREIDDLRAKYNKQFG